MKKCRFSRIRLWGILLSISLAVLGLWTFRSVIRASSDQVEVWENMGIYGGLINDAVVDPATDRVYIAMSGFPGMYYSDDYGDNWTGLEPGEPGAHKMIAASDGSIYAVFNELRRKESDSDTWEIVLDAYNAPAAGGISTFDVDRNDPEHIVVSTGSGIIFVSWDGGNEWVTSTLSVSGTTKLIGISIDPSDPAGNIVYAINSDSFDYTEPSIVSRSEDGGLIFSPVFTAPASEQFFAVGANISGTVFAGGTPGLYRSEDGSDWGRVISDTEIYFIDFDIADPDIVYVDVHISNNNGVDWDPFDVHEYFAQSPNNPEIMFTLSNLGIKRSLNGGLDWEEVVEGIEGIGIADSVSDPMDNQIMYVTSDYGLGITFDGGENWNFPLEGFPGGRALAVDPSTSGTFYAGSGNEVYKLINYGVTWTHRAIGTMPGWSQITEIAIDPSDNERIYAASAGFTPSIPGAFGGLYISESGGSSWVTSTLHGLPVQAVVAVPTLTDTLLVAGVGDPAGYTGSGGIYRSSDSGNNWTQVSMPEKIILALAAHPTNPDILYAGSYYPTSIPPLYRSMNGGRDWDPVGLTECGEIFDIAIDPNDPDIIVVSCVNTIYKSFDGGDNWDFYYEERPGGQIFTVHVPLLPPPPVSEFSAEPLTNSVRLEWSNPGDPDLVGTHIRYLTQTFPSAHTMGITLTTQTGDPGSSGIFTHTDVVSGTTYYYAAFAYDVDGRYSDPAWVTATVPMSTSYLATQPPRPENTTNMVDNQQGVVFISTSYGLYRNQEDVGDIYMLHLPLIKR